MDSDTISRLTMPYVHAEENFKSSCNHRKGNHFLLVPATYILSVQLKVWNISDINFINSAAALRFVAILDRKAR